MIDSISIRFKNQLIYSGMKLDASFGHMQLTLNQKTILLEISKSCNRTINNSGDILLISGRIGIVV